MTKRVPVLRPKKEQAKLEKRAADGGFIYCAMCKCPIQRDRNTKPGAELWYHLQPQERTWGHFAMPEPPELKGKISVIQLLSESSNLLQDWRTRLTQSSPWVGPSQITRIEGGYKMEICIPISFWETALEDGLKHGLYAGKLPASAKPKTVKLKADDEIEEVEDEKGEKKRVVKKKETTKTGRATATPGGSNIKDWWQCPTCKRRIKSGADFHYGKSPQCLKKG